MREDLSVVLIFERLSRIATLALGIVPRQTQLMGEFMDQNECLERGRVLLQVTETARSTALEDHTVSVDQNAQAGHGLARYTDQCRRVTGRGDLEPSSSNLRSLTLKPFVKMCAVWCKRGG